MLALASLATGFVVAAVTPSHAAHGETLPKADAKDSLSALDRTLGSAESLPDVPDADDALGQRG